MSKDVDWRKDMTRHMWYLSDLERKKRGRKMTDEERVAMQESLKENVARLCRMASQKTAGQRDDRPHDLDTLYGGLDHTQMMICIAATNLCLDGVFGPMPDAVETDCGKRRK